MFEADKLYKVCWETTAVGENCKLIPVLAQTRAVWDEELGCFVPCQVLPRGLNEELRVEDIYSVKPLE